MAEPERPTPEKQLLNLIESPKSEQVQAENLKRRGRQWFSLGALKARFPLPRWPSFKNFAKTSFGVRQVNLSLKISIIFLALYLGYNVVVMALELKKASNLIFSADKISPSPAQFASPLKDMPYYLGKAAARDIFGFGASPVIQQKKELGGPVVPKDDRTRDFSLVGIAWSANPEAMIEDTKNKRTNFARKGQVIEGEIAVVAIFKDHVVLNYKGKEFELK